VRAFIWLLMMLVSGSVLADIPSPTPIEECREQSIKAINPSTAKHGEELAAYSECLERGILKLAEKIYSKEDHTKVTATIKQQLKQLSNSYRNFYEHLYNGNKWCPCGQIMVYSEYSAYNELLEKMIVDMQEVLESGLEFDESQKNAPYELPVDSGMSDFPNANKTIFSQ
jgi:hypothetical protein